MKRVTLSLMILQSIMHLPRLKSNHAMIGALVPPEPKSI